MTRRRPRSVSHREGAIAAGFDLPKHEGAGCTRNRRAWFWRGPWARMEPRLDREPEQLMPRRMEFHLVEAVTVTVERPELRYELVGVETSFDRFRTSQGCTQSGQFTFRPARAFAPRALPHLPLA